jgi:1,4-alpha-glucan branching enzyme
MTSIRPDGRVEFRFFRPNASDVKVLGSFNQWDGDSLTLEPEGDGWWSANSAIEPGEYRFRYWADGHWFTDYASHGVEWGKHGWNSVLVVPTMSTMMIDGMIQSTNEDRRNDYTIEMKAAA